MRLYEKYQKELLLQLKDELKISNVMAVPKLEKIVVNVGIGEALSDHKVVDRVAEQLAAITGQKAAPARARVSISAFKLRAGEIVGMKVTLRGKRMYDFMQKLVNVVLPRMRDFQGVKRTAFDSHGNYHLGLSEQIIFPEIDYSKIDKIRGLEISFVTSTKEKGHAFRLLELLGMPFTKEKAQ